jgi:hypothetical protein
VIEKKSAQEQMRHMISAEPIPSQKYSAYIKSQQGKHSLISVEQSRDTHT